MPKNRDYTGLKRTPSSMARLISQRSILRGKLEKLKALQASLPERIQSLEADLASIDAAIPLHEVKVDPTVIRRRRPHRPPIADYGVMNRTLLQRLRKANGRPPFTNELAMEVASARRRLPDDALRRLKGHGGAGRKRHPPQVSLSPLAMASHSACDNTLGT